MRKFIGLAVVIAFLWVSAAPAEAVSLPLGDIEAKLRDYTTFFTDFAPVDGVPETPRPNLAEVGAPPFTLAAIGDEIRAAFTITSMFPQGNPGSTFFTAGGSEELTGVVYDLEVASIYSYGAGGPIFVPLTTASVGTYVLDLVPFGRTATLSPVAGAGGRIEIYSDMSPDFDASGGGLGPAGWTEGPPDTFPTATDGSLWLAADFVPFAAFKTYWPLAPPGAATVYQLEVSLVTDPVSGFSVVSTGTAHSFADVVVNNTNRPFLDDGYGPPGSGADLDISSSTLRSDLGAGGWAVGSEDPVLFTTLPEPATMSLLLVGLVGGAGAYLRRRRAA